ncbi:MAG: type II secretion system F family protein [Patescibacteria group bacterium]
MSLFIYEAINEEGRIVVSEINSLNKEEVISVLNQKHLTPIRIELKSDSAKFKGLGSTVLFERFTELDKIIMIRNLGATIKAGLTLSEALEIMVVDSNKKIVKDFLLEAQQSVLNGQSLSSVFEKHNNNFSPIFSGMIRAGEGSGMLDKSLEELNHHLNREYNLIKKVKAALTYPLILVVASIAIVIVMLVFVLPNLSKSFAQNNIELPLLTKILIQISNALSYSFLLDIFIVAGLVYFFMYFKKTKVGKNVISYLMFNIPVFKKLIKKIMLVRFSRTLGSLISGSLSISESLSLTAKAVGNDKYEEAILGASADIKNGISLSESLKNREELFPNFLTSLIAVGEKTGTLGKVLENFSDFYEEDVSAALTDLTTLLEPLLLLFMGLTVGLIAIAILMPIYSMVGSFKY